MTGYLEIFGQSFTTPDPDSVASLSARYSGLCATIADAKSGLTAIGSPQANAEWAGQAADTFASKLSNLPGQLEQAWQSYDAVARALSGYASSLRPVVFALNSLASQAEEAEGTLSATQAAREQAIRQGEPSASIVWNARVSDAQVAVDQLKGRQSTLLAELRSCSSECVRQVQQASAESIHSSLITDLRHDLTDVGRVLWRAGDDEFHFGFTMAKDLVRVELAVDEDLYLAPFVSLFRAADAYMHSQSWVNLGQCLDAISGILAICSLACPPLALVAIGVGVLGLEADTFAAVDQEQGASWTDVGFDAVNLGLMGVTAGLGLADGPDADEAGASLWDTVEGNYLDFDPDDPTPAGVGEFVIDRVDDGITVVEDQWQKDGGS
jgi:uncharacterized protein YukE